MRLNRLVLQGYKSFASKTEFVFPTGITAIVGPNGSGKSNIADAIRWVLGEQSLRSLRGKSSADMIFAGGRRRARAGMAEVSITLDNADGWLPIEFSEVTISRRAYRSGQNEYLLNGARVRLRDITELLAEGGLGKLTYVVIGQGLVDAALSLRPQERRMLFEDAAGIGLYRSQREEALCRLEETERNLERVYDIISEIMPRLKRLERDAKRVTEYQRIEAHLERLQRTWYGYLWGRQQAVLDQALATVAVLETQLADRQANLAELETQLVQLRQQEADLRTQLQDWHSESAESHTILNGIQRDMAVAEERARLLQLRREELEAELEPLEEQRAAQEEKIVQAERQIEALEREQVQSNERLAAVEEALAEAQALFQPLARRRAELEQALEERRGQLDEIDRAIQTMQEEAARRIRERAVAEERARQLEVRRAELVAELAPLEQEQAAQAERIQSIQAQVAHWKSALDEHRQHLLTLESRTAWQAERLTALDAHQQKKEALLQKLRREQEVMAQLRTALHDAQAEVARLTGEQEALRRRRAAGAVYDAGVQAFLDANLEGVLGPLATLIRVPEKWEEAIEAALGNDLQTVVVTHATLEQEARRVLERSAGRVTLLPLDRLRLPPALPPQAKGATNVIAPLDPSALAVIQPAIEALLGNVALCESLEEAQALLPQMPPGSCCVTADGSVFRTTGAVSVGQISVAGLLADERAWQELPVELAAVRRRYEETEHRLQEASDRVAMLEEELATLERRITEAREQAARAHQEAVAQAQTALAVAQESLKHHEETLQRESALEQQMQAELRSLQEQIHQVEAERAEIVARLQPPSEDEGIEETGMAFAASSPVRDYQQQLTTQQRRAEAQRRAVLEQITKLEKEIQDLTQQMSAASEEVARMEREEVAPVRTECALLETSLRNQREVRQREATLLKRIETQQTARRERIAELTQEHLQIADRMEALRAQGERLESRLANLQSHIQPAETELGRIRKQQGDLERQERRARERVRDAENRLNQAQLEAARCRDELKLLARQIEEDLGLVELELSERVTAQTPLPLHPLVSALPIVEELPAGLEEEIQRLKAHLRRLGAINPNAPAEYAETHERHQFLSNQCADLEAAAERVRQVVVELDELMESTFQTMFEAVATHFSELFTTLFGGGSAHLELTEPDNLLNTGVDIVARPPGKRAQRLALLSGGERALTAVALLFAILKVSPAPFCVLDEVDAMLDEANVGRFRTLLKERSQETQFIVITHTRGTVEAADTIYGVSMASDAASQVVSLDLEQV